MPSSVIDSIEYDEERMLLRVVFLSGKVYCYLEVPYEVYLSFRSARSKGRYLNRYIKDIYEYESSAH